jgi:cell division protein FtsB
MTSPRASLETPKAGGGYKLLGGITLPVAVAMVGVLLFSHRGLYQIYRLRHERLRLEQENARLGAENARLARTIDRLHHDPVLIQDLIRRELNFVKRNDLIFQFPPETPVTAASLDPRGHRGPPWPSRTHGFSERRAGTSNWVSEPGPGSAPKRAGRRE